MQRDVVAKAGFRTAIFNCGDCLFLIVVGLVATGVMHMVHHLGWHMVLTLAVGMVAAMFVQMLLAHAVAPTALSHRFLREDIACTVGLVQALARVARVPTPTIDAMVHLANVLLGEDLRAGGRDLAALGWDGLGRDEIVRAMRA